MGSIKKICGGKKWRALSPLGNNPCLSRQLCSKIQNRCAGTSRYNKLTWGTLGFTYTMGRNPF